MNICVMLSDVLNFRKREASDKKIKKRGRRIRFGIIATDVTLKLFHPQKQSREEEKN